MSSNFSSFARWIKKERSPDTNIRSDRSWQNRSRDDILIGGIFLAGLIMLATLGWDAWLFAQSSKRSDEQPPPLAKKRPSLGRELDEAIKILDERERIFQKLQQDAGMSIKETPPEGIEPSSSP